jgi:predicted metalloprotease with PDZ domain
MPTSPHSAPVYRIEIADLKAHLFRVTLTLTQPAPEQEVSLPVWIPGSYMVREFSGQLQRLEAKQGRRRLTAQQLDKCSWRLNSRTDQPLTLSYEVYANDPSVRTAMLGHERGFFNATSLCLRVHGQDESPLVLEIPAPRGQPKWTLATALAPLKTDKRGFGRYLARDYDELADSPVTFGLLWSGQFKACGVNHRLVVSGAPPAFDGQRLLADTQKVCEAQIRFWHGPAKPPFKHYVFMLHVVSQGYGGLEHGQSTALICGRKDLPALGSTQVSEGYTTLRGLISHEYFHTWNVKRLRPQAFTRYDYSRENYSDLLWFFEGFTSYYDDLLLRRCGLLDNAGYLKLLNKTINQVMQTPGRQVQSVAQASFDAWVKYYRQDENTPNATVSYYTKGALVALCFDLSLRAPVKGKPAPADVTLDAVMRHVWKHCKGGPMQESDLSAALLAVSGRSFDAELAAWVHGKAELPLQPLLEQHGVSVLEDPAQLAQRLGLRVSESAGITVKAVLRGGAAERAGFAAGDEWLGIALAGPAGAKVKAASDAGWRLNRLEDLLLYAGQATQLQALVARDKRLLRLQLSLPPQVTTWRLSVQDTSRVNAWLQPTAT